VAAGPDGDAHAHEPIGPPYSKTADSLVYVFGGLTAEYGVSNDFYTFDPINLQWNVIDRFGGQAPTRRAGHCLEPDRTTQKLYVFGGRGSTGVEATGTLIWAMGLYFCSIVVLFPIDCCITKP